VVASQVQHVPVGGEAGEDGGERLHRVGGDTKVVLKHNNVRQPLVARPPQGAQVRLQAARRARVPVLAARGRLREGGPVHCLDPGEAAGGEGEGGGCEGGEETLEPVWAPVQVDEEHVREEGGRRGQGGGRMGLGRGGGGGRSPPTQQLFLGVLN
jgi:hypothetical protein